MGQRRSWKIYHASHIIMNSRTALNSRYIKFSWREIFVLKKTIYLRKKFSFCPRSCLFAEANMQCQSLPSWLIILYQFFFLISIYKFSHMQSFNFNILRVFIRYHFTAFLFFKQYFCVCSLFHVSDHHSIITHNHTTTFTIIIVVYIEIL